MHFCSIDTKSGRSPDFANRPFLLPTLLVLLTQPILCFADLEDSSSFPPPSQILESPAGSNHSHPVLLISQSRRQCCFCLSSSVFAHPFI